MALTDNLISYWKLDEPSGVTATDEKSANNGANTNATVNQSGKLGTSYSFGGTAYITVANESNFDFDIGNTYSFSAWVYYTTEVATGNCIISKRLSGSPYTGINFGMFPHSTKQKLALLHYHYNGSTHKYIYSRDTAEMTKNAWVHVVATYDGSGTKEGMKLYKNGTEVTYVYDDYGPVATLLTNEPVRIGVDLESNRYFKGSIDEVGVWSKVLSSSEVTALYNSGNGLTYPFVTSSIKTFNGLVYASVSKKNGIVLASIKNVNGLV